MSEQRFPLSSSTGIVRQVEIWPLRIPFKKPLQIAVGGQRQSLEVVIVRLQTDEGVFGLGETQAWLRLGSNETLAGLLDVLHNQLIPLLVGRSIFDIASIAELFDQAIYGRLPAKAALLDAIYDAQGRLLNVPVWQLLGGRARQSIETGAVLTISQPEQAVTEALSFYQQGYRHFSVKAGKDMTRDIQTLALLRQELGDEIRLLVDANASLEFDGALRLLKSIEPFNIEAVEQPLAPQNIRGLAELAARSDIPIVLDESITTPADLLNIIPQHIAHAFHSKTSKSGGLWHLRPLWQLAHSAGWRVRAGNHPSTSLATLAVAHLATAWPHRLIPSPFTQSVTHDLEGDVVSESLPIHQAYLTVSDAPGFGVELDIKQLARWQVS